MPRLNGLDKYKQRGNIVDRVKSLERSTTRYARTNLRADELNEIAGFTGNLDSGNAQIGEDGVTYANGAGYFDDDGGHVNGSRFALEHIYGTRAGRIEMIGNSGAPDWKFSFFSTAENANLVPNGDFATGDLTNWTVGALAVTPAPSGTVELGGDGIYYAHLTTITQDGGKFTGTLFNVTAGNGYRIKTRSRGGKSYLGITTDGSDFHYISVVDASEEFVQNDLTFRAGAGVTQLAVKIYLDEADYTDFAQIELRELDVYSDIVFDDNGLSVLKWGTSTSAGVDQDTNDAASHTDQMQEVSVNEAIKITGALWDVRNTGDYSLFLMGSNGYAIRTLWTGNVAAGGEITMTFNGPLVLTTGLHYLVLRRTTGATTWWETDALYGAVDADFRLGRLSRDAGANWVSNCAPVKLVYQPGAWS